MATRTIGISDDVYERLAALKRQGESFNDVLRRLTGGALLRQLAGTMDAETAAHYRRAIAEGRARQDEDRRARLREWIEGG